MTFDLFQRLLSTFGDDLKRGTDDEESFGYSRETSDPAELGRWLDALARQKLCKISVEGTVAGGLTLALNVVATKRLSVPVDGVRYDEARYQGPADEPLRREIKSFENELRKTAARIERDELIRRLTGFARRGLALDLKLGLYVRKEEWRKHLVGEPPGKVVLFVFARNLATKLEGMTLEELAGTWFRDSGSQPTIFLVLDAGGWLSGRYTACFGGDKLGLLGDGIGDPRDFEHLRACWSLCDGQGGWKGQPAVLTPDHFEVQDRGLKGDGCGDLVRELQVLAAQLAICYLANRTDGHPDPRESRFYDHPVAADREALRKSIKKPEITTDKLMALYRWTYQSHSEAQLHVAQRAIRLKLDEDRGKNLDELLVRADAIQKTAADSLQQAFKEKVDELFKVRKEVCEYLRDHNREIAVIVGDLTDALIGNLFKTLAALIAALVAAGVSSRPGIAVVTTGALYTIYILFILCYQMPAIWRKSKLTREEYDSNVKNLTERYSLTEEEREKFDLPSLQASEEFFRSYFRATAGIYSVLGAVAALLTGIFGG